MTRLVCFSVGMACCFVALLMFVSLSSSAASAQEIGNMPQGAEPMSVAKALAVLGSPDISRIDALGTLLDAAVTSNANAEYIVCITLKFRVTQFDVISGEQKEVDAFAFSTYMLEVKRLLRECADKTKAQHLDEKIFLQNLESAVGRRLPTKLEALWVLRHNGRLP